MKLPLSFFDKKRVGDLLQRIDDYNRIHNFLTTISMQFLYSMINLIVFSIVLGIYSLEIMIVFVVASIIYLFWLILFFNKRRELDNARFEQLSESQNHLIQIIEGIQEVKLNSCEKRKRWEWEDIQNKLFRINTKKVSYNQYQKTGAIIINEIKNIFITVLAAESVISGKMTLGMMLAVQYIMGQLNGPIEQMIDFFRYTQEAKISLERLLEFNKIKEELLDLLMKEK